MHRAYSAEGVDVLCAEEDEIYDDIQPELVAPYEMERSYARTGTVTGCVCDFYYIYHVVFENIE